MNKRATRLAAAAVIAVAGMYLLIVLLNSMRPVISSEVFIYPGRFLYLCFLDAAFYVPLLFLISSFLLFADYYNSRIFIVKILSLFPFFTFSLLLRILNYMPGSPAADGVINNLGVRGGSMVLGLLLIIELLIIARVLIVRKSSAVYRSEAPQSAALKSPEVKQSSHSGAEIREHNFEPVSLEWERPVLESRSDEIISEEAVANVAQEIEEIEPIEVEETDDHEFDIMEIPLEDSEEQEVVEPIDIYPLDLDLDDSDENSDEDEVDDKGSEGTQRKHYGDEDYPDAPIRGDEGEISEAAKAVWADAEELGFDDVLPGENSFKDPPEFIEVKTPEEDDLMLDIDIGSTILEIPDVMNAPKVEAVAEVLEEYEEVEEVEELEDLSSDIDSVIDIDPLLASTFNLETEIEPVSELVSPEEFEIISEIESEPETGIENEVLVPDLEPYMQGEPEGPVETAIQAEPELPPKPVKKKRPGKYSVPVENILEHYDDNNYWIVDKETKAAAEVLRETLEEFKIAAEVTGISKGPVITMFEILPAPGVKLSKIVNLADNIALRLAASRVRIVAPIPGKHAVGIEVPNKERAIVSFKEILEADNLKKSRMAIPVVLGKDITGGARVIDLVQTPHLLIAGATGSGKSVSVNSLICSVLYARAPEEVKMILIDPKIVELKMYNDIPHLLTPVITEPKRAFQALQYAMCEMERRYTLLNALGVRDIKSYNRKVRDGKLATDTLPYIVIIVDEFADLMATTGKELENVISRLAAMSRAIGIHLVLATQRPSVDVITGLIKANIPSRIAFMVASKTDSRIILDSMGADKLLGKGDMLFTSAWDPNPVRIQGAFLSDDEVERITDHVKTLGEPDYIDDEIFISEDEGGVFELESQSGADPLMDSAVQIVVEAGKASASYLQRRLKIGYNRAARLVEDMEDRGIVGPANGSKPRDIIHIPDRV